MRVEIRVTNDLSDDEMELISRERGRIDYGMPAWGYQWAPKTWRALVWDGGKLVSHVGIVERTVDVYGRPVKAGGISGVWTLPECRGRGFGTLAMQAAAAFIRDELGADFALLLCRWELAAFYERLGWRLVTGPVVFEQPSGKVEWQLAGMVLPCRGLGWPDGTIDLCGLPW